MGQCITPFGVRDKKTNETISVPCGKCPECTSRRISGWSFRLMQQERVASSAHFITLTYDTSHVPITENGFMTVRKEDLQKFLKRLRHLCPEKIKYYAAAEYGSSTWRPHYHLIMFNVDLAQIQKAWGLGHVHYGQVSAASVGYTLKYISKPSRIPLHRNDDRQREFALMSKGLGLDYVTDNMKSWHTSALHTRMYCVTQDNKKISMPRYYKEKIYNEHQRKAIGLQARIIVEETRQREIEECQAKGLDYERERVEKHKAAFKRASYKATFAKDKL